MFRLEIRPAVLWIPEIHLHDFAYGAITLYGRAFQLTSTRQVRQCSGPNTTSPILYQHWIRFVLLSLRSPLLAQSLLISFPAGTKMFQFSAWRFRAIRRELQVYRLHGCPIQQCPVLWLHAPRRTFSQLARTFVATQAKQFPKWHGSQLPSVLYLWPLHRINMNTIPKLSHCLFAKMFCILALGFALYFPGASSVKYHFTNCVQYFQTLNCNELQTVQTHYNPNFIFKQNNFRSRRLRMNRESFPGCNLGTATNQSRLWNSFAFSSDNLFDCLNHKYYWLFWCD